MANINKIRLSGQTYNIQDENATKTVELTQAQYDALTVKDPNTFYIITDSQGADLSNYYTKSETSGATEISTALNAKQDTLSAGTNITIVDNVISATGGGKAVSGGTNISITTGETADTINCTLNITNGTGPKSIVISNGKATDTSSFAIGDGTKNQSLASEAKGITSFSCGLKTIANKNYSAAFGDRVNTNNANEFSCGRFNNSVSVSTTLGDSGNTLFSVGNGTADNARHNAFEIRQNGDIYITSGGTDIKLQDNLGGGGSSYTAGDGIDITNDVISVTGKVDTSAFTAHTADTVIHVTSAEKAAWNAKSDFSGSYNDLTDKPTIPTVPTSNTAFTNDAGYITSDAISGKADTSAVTESINAAVSGKVDTSTFNTYSGSVETALGGKQATLVSGTNIKTINNESILGEGNIEIQGGGKAISAGRGISVATGETADTVSFNLPISAGTGTNSLVAGSSSSTASGTNSFAGGDDAIASGNWSFAFGRGKATNNYAFAANGGSKATRGFSAAFNTSEANNTYAFSCGTSKSNGYASFSSGWDNKSLSDYESSFGYYNVSNKANTTWGDSGNTLFSVGNGTADNARHNAFEIRQNGDIYITSGGTDIKLQDNLGGGGSVDQTVISGSTNAVSGGAVYSQLGGMKIVKLTESEYTALVTKDSDTLYVVVPDPSN